MVKSNPTLNFKAFADASSSSQIDQLSLENQGDRLSLYGSLQISCDQQGLQRAKQLQQVITDAIAYLEAQPQLADKIRQNTQIEEIDNPFL